uniref:Uncharacterized protein n=1 Tax=Cannabis sativa TaxID=3483 RepID=A0A803NGS0_CANSA
MVSSIRALQSNSNFTTGIKPHPQPLTIAESSSTEKPVTTLPDKCPEMPLPFPSYNPTIFSADIPQIPPSLLKDPQSTQSSHPSSISPVTEAATTTTGVGKHKGKSVIIEETSDDVPAFSKSFKRQVNPENFRTLHSDVDLTMIICLMWSIWSERNKENHGTKPKPAAMICNFAVAYLDQYHKANSPRNTAAVSSANLVDASVQQPSIPD